MSASNPWHVHTVSEGRGDTVRLEGDNAYTGKPFIWCVTWHSFRDPGFVSRRYNFKGVQFLGNGKRRLTETFRLAKKLR